MRLVAIIVSFVSLMVAGVAFFYVSGLDRGRETAGTDNAMQERIAGLEKRVGELQQTAEKLRTDSEMLAERITAAEMPAGRVAPVRREAASGSEDTASGSGTDNPNPPEEPGESDERTALRRTIREEIKNLEEERKEEQKREWEAQKPEEWEREEFGFYAHTVHNTGRKLGMTVDQKRKYYSILKGHQDETSGLWEQLQKQYPKADNKELGQLYRDRTKDLLDSTRQFVKDMLTAPQRKKYDEMCKESNWFR